MSLQGGRWPAWAHGGRELIFLTPDGQVQRTTIDARQDGSIGAPRTLFVVPTWRRSLFDDPGSGFVVVGDGDRYMVRQSPSGLAVSYVQHWRTLLRHADSSASTSAKP
ncbi:MAG: hypothetical protein ABJD11_17670 [Gemmatimonadota bacterium]